MRLSRGMLVVVLTLALLPQACRQLSPEERIQSLRAQYTAELNSFYVEPSAEEAVEVGEEAADEEAVGEGEVAEEGDVIEEQAVATTNVVLDILVATEAMEYLPGLTVDVSQADASGQEKAHWRLWVDTSEVIRGPGMQVTKVLEDVAYEEGDGFFVEVRGVIPAEERGEYREFSEAG